MKRKFVQAPAMLVAAVLCLSTSQAQQKNDKSEKIEVSRNITSVRSDGSGETLINYEEQGHRYKIRLEGSKIVEMYVDDKKIPEGDYTKYEPTVKRILEQIEQDRKQAERDRAQAEIDRAQAEKDREQAVRDRAQAEQDRKRAEKDREQAQKDRERAEQDRAQAEKDRAQAAIDRKKAEEDRKRMQAMLDEIVSDKLADTRESITSLELDESKLVINGKEQPANIHSRYKQKYLKGTNQRIHYRNVGGNKTISL